MINSIQVLRVVAAIGVVMAHYELFGVRAGGFGVDIFFIISGFIIAFVVNTNTSNFLKKRIARVVPLYTFATLLTTFLVLLKPSWFNNAIVNFEAVFKSLLYIPYRINNSGPVLSLGWTLNNEMFFYIVMAISIFFVSKKKYLSITCASIILFIFFILNIFDTDNYVFNFYKEGLLPEFVFGILLYYLWNYYKGIQSKKGDQLILLLGIISFVFLVYVDITGEFKIISRNIWRGIPSFFVAFSFLISEKFFNSKTRFSKILLELGDSSYVMYLFHPYIIFGLTRIIYPVIFKDNSSIFVELIKFIIMIVVLCVISILMYRFIDRPMAKYARKILKA